MNTTADTQSAQQFALLGQRRFAPLFWVQTLGAFNDQVYKTGFVTLLTFRLADEMGLDVTFHNLVAAAMLMLPFALFSPIAGQIADGVDKAKMMRWIKAAEILLMIGGAIAFHLQSLTLLYIVLFLTGTQSAIFAPIKYGIVPQYLREHELINGNGLIQGMTFLAILLGQIVGAKLVLTDNGITLISIAIIAISLIGFIWSWFAQPAPPLGAKPKVDWFFPIAIWKVVKSGASNKRAFAAILGISWFWFVGSVFLALLPAYVKEGLGGNEDVFILLLSTFSIGVAIGAVLCGRIFGTKARVKTASFGAFGIASASVLLWLVARNQIVIEGAALTTIGGFLASPVSWGIIMCFLVIAISAGLYLTPLNTVLQLAAPANERGRFVACMNTVSCAAMVSASLVAGVMASAGGLSQLEILGTIGATGILATIWAASWKD